MKRCFLLLGLLATFVWVAQVRKKPHKSVASVPANAIRTVRDQKKPRKLVPTSSFVQVVEKKVDEYSKLTGIHLPLATRPTFWSEGVGPIDDISAFGDEVGQSLKISRFEAYGWQTPEPENPKSTWQTQDIARIRKTISARLVKAGWKIVKKKAQIIGSTSASWGFTGKDGFEARKAGRLIVGVWHRNDGMNGKYLTLFWGERVPQTAQRILDDALVAAINGHSVQGVKSALARGADARTHDYVGNSVLVLAAATGQAEFVRFLLQANAKSGMTGNDLNAALSRVAYAVGGDSGRNYGAVAGVLLDAGADFRTKDKKGFTALERAAEEGVEDVVRAILTKRAGVVTHKDMERALVIASVSLVHTFSGPTVLNRSGIVKLLLASGTDEQTRVSALKAAAQDDEAGIVPLLLAAGIDAKKYADELRQALISAASSPYYNSVDPTVKALVEHGADVNASGDTAKGDTALMKAAETGQTPTVQYLLDHGADINARDDKGQTALMRAIALYKTEVVELLKAAGAKS